MPGTNFSLSILLLLLLVLLGGCRSGEPASNAAAKSTPADNSNQTVSSAAGNTNASTRGSTNATATASEPAQLLGTYESREVVDQGVVTLISQLRTLWMFSADGTYSRVSEVKGNPYHADSGTFRVDRPDKLVLTIQVTGLKGKRKIQSPPLTKTHQFSLSPDGEELKLTSAKGSVGIFRRVSKPKPQ